MKVDYRITNLPFKYPFTTSKGTKTHQPALIVKLENFGICGYGEAPAINYYDITVEKMAEDLTAKKQFVEKFAYTDPDRYWHYLHHLFPKNPFLVCALDMASWDMYGKLKRKKLYECWNGSLENVPPTNYTIGIDTIEKMVEKMQANPWPIYKIKLGTEYDVKIIETLRNYTDAILRIDANAAWTLDEALEKINIFKNLGIEFIEQPLAKDDWAGMKSLFQHSPLSLIADESCVMETDVEKCADHFHGVNIKLTKCSGITPALRMIRKAKEFNMKVMIGSMNESSIGSAAIAHLSTLADYVDMDGPLLLNNNIATGLSFDKYGKVILNNNYGMGVDPMPHLF